MMREKGMERILIGRERSLLVEGELAILGRKSSGL
jgi:hypothetical protein